MVTQPGIREELDVPFSGRGSQARVEHNVSSVEDVDLQLQFSGKLGKSASRASRAPVG